MPRYWVTFTRKATWLIDAPDENQAIATAEDHEIGMEDTDYIQAYDLDTIFCEDAGDDVADAEPDATWEEPCPTTA